MERKEQEAKQDRRLKTTVQGDNNQPQPQKCPRCESINTKFCYYNNYSLSQPRYFCKTCRRYWTQGGTLRNIPIGGGCRKGKRLKTSAAASPSSGENLRPQLQPQNQNLVANSAAITANKESSDPANLINSNSIGSFYPAGGFLSSLAAVQNLCNNSATLPVNPVDLGGIAAANLSILNGFNGRIAQQRQIYPIESQNWQQFSGNSSSIVADTALWSISTSTTAANNNSNASPTVSASISASAASFPLNQSDNQWPHLSGFGNSPP